MNRGTTLVLAIATFGLVAALVATAFPLIAYTLGLAAFGLAHVLCELRYVDQRFGPRLARSLRGTMMALLGFVVAGRTAVIAGWFEGRVWAPIELMLVAVLALTVLKCARAARPFAVLLAVCGGLALVAGALYAPVTTLVVLAVAHNLTPIGFLAERLGGRERVFALVACIALLVPAAAIAGGQPSLWLSRLGWWQPELKLMSSAGTLAGHLNQYVPGAWFAEAHAVHFFSAAVYLQFVHYAAVIYVLPRLGAQLDDPTGDTVLTWPRPGRFVLLVVGASTVSCAAFWMAFSDARAFYSLAAALHAWIEIPLLLLALTPQATLLESASSLP